MTQNFEELIRVYHSIHVYCAIAALVFLALTVILFFQMKIPRVFGELTGRTARKAIDEMTAENAVSGSLNSGRIGEDGRRYRKGKTGSLSTGRLRRNTGRSGNLNQSARSGNLKTEPMYAQMGNAAPYGQPVFGFTGGSQMTAPMNGSYGSQLSVPPENFGSPLPAAPDSYGSQPTGALAGHSDQTLNGQHLYDDQRTEKMDFVQSASSPAAAGPVYREPETETMVLNQNPAPGGRIFVIERSIVEIHTDEVI